jgi:hypothetical protein
MAHRFIVRFLRLRAAADNASSVVGFHFTAQARELVFLAPYM